MQLFDLVHGDIWGPYVEPNICETRYTSRVIWTYMLHSKDQVYMVFKSFLEMIKTRFHKKLEAFRSDNGGEFVSRNMAQLFSDHGIIHQRFCPYSPQQNGMVERRHRTLLDTTRALMFHSNLPLKFWPYSLLIAIWLLNRNVSQILE